MRVLFLTKYTATGPSSRYRVVQFLPFLEARGITWDLHALHGDGYLEARYARHRPSPVYLARRAASRVAVLSRAPRYDLVFIQKELFPHALDLPEWLLRRVGARYVVDLDDAIHLFYEGARGWRRPLRGKMARVLSGASLVLAGNRHLEAYARGRGARAVHFPTVVDTARFQPGPPRVGAQPLVVGWMGTPETAPYLYTLAPALEAAARRVPFLLRVVGAEAPALRGVAVEARPWRVADEVGDLQSMDVGLMPLADDPWSMGKCSLKLLQYMSAGVSAVTSPLGSAPDIVSDGENGFFARGDDEWADRVTLLASSPDLRRAMAERARRTVEARYSLAVWGPRFADALLAAAEGRLPADAGPHAAYSA